MIPQKDNIMAHPSWLTDVYDPKKLTKTLDHVCKAIEKDKKEFNIQALAVRGNSGTLVAGAISMMVNLPIILVRKEGDGSHSDYKVEFNNILKKKGTAGYVVVDDIISSGDTIRSIFWAVQDHLPLLEMKKIYLYNGHRNEPLYIGGESVKRSVPVQYFGF